MDLSKFAEVLIGGGREQPRNVRLVFALLDLIIGVFTDRSEHDVRVTVPWCLAASYWKSVKPKVQHLQILEGESPSRPPLHRSLQQERRPPYLTQCLLPDLILGPLPAFAVLKHFRRVGDSAFAHSRRSQVAPLDWNRH